MASRKKKPPSVKRMADKVKVRKVDSLIPYAKNARTHSGEQVREIADSIEKFGWTNPILIADSGILAGHGRLAAAILLGRESVPTIDLSYLTEQERKAYIIADNRLAEKAGWNLKTLASELDELQTDGFDLNLVGFTEDEVGKLMDGLYGGADSGGEGGDGGGGGGKENLVDKWDVRLNQTWGIGPHRVFVGASDAGDLEVVAGILERVSAAGFVVNLIGLGK